MKSGLIWVAIISLMPLNLQAQNLASPEETAAAIGHYARARTMLMEALKEFERARELAQPDLIVNGDDWRNTLLSRANDLNRLISPEARISRTGVRFEASHALLQEENEREQMPMKVTPRDTPRKADARAKIKAPTESSEHKDSSAKKALNNLLSDDQASDTAPAKADDSDSVEAVTADNTADELATEKQIPTDADSLSATHSEPASDDEVAKAIEERLRSLEATEAK